MYSRKTLSPSERILAERPPEKAKTRRKLERQMRRQRIFQGQKGSLASEYYHGNEHEAGIDEHGQDDTKTDRVLFGAEYTYWGGEGLEIPKIFP